MNVHRANAEELLNYLSNKDKKRVLALTNHYKHKESNNNQSYYDSNYDSDEEKSTNNQNNVTEESQIKGILRTNAMAMGYDPSLSCFYEIASRINHTCDCNSRYMWCEDNNMRMVFSITKITKAKK